MHIKYKKKKEVIKLISTLKKKFNKNNKFTHLHEPYLKGKEKEYLNEAINKSMVSSFGHFHKKFENKIKKITNSKYVILTSSGTAAIHLSLLTSGIQTNDEVLMPNLNYIASANATIYCKAIPHLIDVRDHDLAVDPLKLNTYLKKALLIKKNYSINKKTGRIVRCLICLHTFGHAAEIDKIKNLCSKFKIILIEDAAEALGTYYKNKHVGTFGNSGILSFNGNKIITTGGGGALITNNKNVSDKAKHLSQISKIKHKFLYQYSELGYNYKLPNINCALGLAQIRNIRKILKMKRNNYYIYKVLFKNFSFFKLFTEPKNSKSNYWLQTIILNSPDLKIRNKILNLTNNNRISTRPVWQLLSSIKYLKGCPKMNLKNSIRLEKRIINIPSSPDI